MGFQYAEMSSGFESSKRVYHVQTAETYFR